MPPRTVLSSFSATGGFLANCRVDFAPGLTCIIGARGTCKSTLVESIRFAFDHDPERIRELLGVGERRTLSTFNLVGATLGAGSVRCETTVQGGPVATSHVVEREVGGEPRVFLDGVREHASRDILHQVEIFSQGDLQLIADDKHEDLRLALIDRPNAVVVKKLKADRDSWEIKLRTLGPELRVVRAQIATLRQELLPLAGLGEQLRQVLDASPPLGEELEAENASYQRRRRVLGALDDLQTALEAAAGHFDRAADELGRVRTCIAAVRDDSTVDVSLVASELDALESSVSDAFKVRGRLREIPLRPAVDALSLDFEAKNAPFFAMRQAQQQVNESLKQQQHLARQIEALEKRQRDLESAMDRESELLRAREEARAAVARIDDEVFSLRIREVEDINSSHGDAVALTLKTGASSPRYSTRVSALLAGSRVRGQDEVATALAETFSPAALVDIVESGSGQRFADTLQRDLGQMNRVVAHLAEHPDLYGLEAEPPTAKLDITLFDNGTPKPVETLSKGQKATALLPLILRPLPYPLIVDQPEDDLDNSFIFNSLVRYVGELKLARQLIFVTHNANIPVLGGADRVVVMQMQSPTSAAPCLVGTVEERKREILDLLEGGAEAFQRREEHYHDLLPGSGR